MTLIEHVNAALENVVASIVMPSFRSLRPEDIHRKDTPGDPDDLVTIVDRAAERYLIDSLSELIPGATFIGEEATDEDPSLLEALSRPEPAWLIDPVDGTKNFAHGNAHFGVMLALVEGGLTTASWMAVPAALPSGFVVVAQRGKGTQIDGLRIAGPHRVPPVARGTIHTRMMPTAIAREVVGKTDGKYDALPSTGSAATEYSAIIRGEKDFVIYFRLLPWDHAPGTLAVTEAGGAAVHLSGHSYSPLSPNQITIVAATRELADTIRAWLT